MQRHLIRLIGRVQGVGMRAQIAQIAQRFAVAGDIRNLRSVSAVEIDVEGSPDEVERFIAAVLDEPPLDARIDAVERRDVPLGQKRGFRIAPTSD